MTLSDLLVAHSSPTLAGMKSGSLISLRQLSEKGDFSRKELEAKGLSFFTLSNKKGEKLLLVYREKKLIADLGKEEARKILKECGYPDNAPLNELLLHLRKRFLSADFPHEVGLFLSYPPEDVEGFIENGGKGYVFSGLWKVYTDAEKAMKTQEMYEKCRKSYEHSYSKGIPIERLCVIA